MRLGSFAIAASTALLFALPAGAANIYSDASQPIVVKAGAQFQITLPADRSAGYRWSVVIAPNPDKVKFISSNYVAPASQAGMGAANVHMAGASGKEVWTFQAVGAGDTVIPMGYYKATAGASMSSTAIVGRTPIKDAIFLVVVQ